GAALPRVAEPPGGHRAGDDEREVEVVPHSGRDGDRIARPESHERRRERGRDAGRGEDGAGVHPRAREHGRLHEHDVRERGERRRAADDLGADVGAVRAELEETIERGAARYPAPCRFAWSGETRTGMPAARSTAPSTSCRSTWAASPPRASAVRVAAA